MKKPEATYSSYITFESSAGPAALAQCLRCGAAVLISRESPGAVAAHDKWHKQAPPGEPPTVSTPRRKQR